MKECVSLLAIAASSALFAALEPISPIQGKTVPLVPDDQKKVMALPTLEARLKLVQSDRGLAKSRWWRRALPLVLEIGTTNGETGPWKVEIGKQADLSDARIWYVGAPKADPATGRETSGGPPRQVATIEVPMANLEVATTYHWRVSCRGRCGFGCHKKHDCKASGRLAVSPIATFATEDLAPRWMAVEGRVGNVRDLGGRKGLGGRRVRQGLAFRGQGLNDNSVTGETQGRNRLTVEDVRYLTETLGIKTDLDLRGIGETADLAVSPLGARVKLILNPSSSYKGIFTKSGKRIMAENFRVFCDRANYPIYFHCIGGADRTGSLAYVLNAVLGVDRHELETDWESTFYPRIPDANPDPEFWCRESHFNEGFSKYGDEKTPWDERVILYLKDCGITDAEIKAFQRIMLQDRQNAARQAECCKTGRTRTSLRKPKPGRSGKGRFHAGPANENDDSPR